MIVTAPSPKAIRSDLPEAVSLYLDLVRFLAALYVFVAHTKFPRFTNGWLDEAGRYASDAVMIFFVLSGLVIAHVTRTKERDLRTYAIARLARLWSVALPALLLTLIADSIGRLIYPPIYDGPWYEGDRVALRLIANALFQGQSWFANLSPLTNTPYWSLGYEFWYYVLFGASHFLRGPSRWVALALCCLLCGPKILLLLPVWLLGVALYRFVQGREMPGYMGWVLWIGSFVGYGLFQALHLPGYLLWRTAQWLGENLVLNQLAWSKDFVASYVVALLVAANFVGFWSIHRTFNTPLLRFRHPIRFLAGFTFSVYLFHMPLLHFFGALIRHDANSLASQATLFVLTVVGILLLGLVTEHKKAVAKRWIEAAFQRFRLRSA